MKRKLKIMTHQVDQLKEEISAKESALVKLHLEQQRIEKEKETLKVQGSSHGWRLPSTGSSHSLKAAGGRESDQGRMPIVLVAKIQKPPASGAARITFVILRPVS